MPIHGCLKISGVVVLSVVALQLILILTIQLLNVALIRFRYTWLPVVGPAGMLLFQFGVLIIILLPYGLELRIQLLRMLTGSGCVLEAAVLYKVIISIGICILGQLLMPLLPGCLQLLLFTASIDGGCCKLV